MGLGFRGGWVRNLRLVWFNKLLGTAFKDSLGTPSRSGARLSKAESMKTVTSFTKRENPKPREP